MVYEFGRIVYLTNEKVAIGFCKKEGDRRDLSRILLVDKRGKL